MTKPEKASPETAFDRDLLDLISTPSGIHPEGTFFAIRGYLYEGSLLIGYLLAEGIDYAVLGFPHLFTMDEESSLSITPLSSSRVPMIKVHPQSTFVGTLIPDEKHTLFFIECTLARLPELAGYFNEQRAANVLAAKNALLDKLGIKLIPKDGSETGLVVKPDTSTFTPPEYSKKRVRH